MADAPTYTSRVGSLDAPSLMVQPRELPTARGTGEAIGAGLEQIGAAVSKLDEAQQHTRVAKATTKYLTDLDTAETNYAKDPDYQNAPTKFGEELTRIKGEALTIQVSPQRKAELETRLERLGLSSAGTVRKAATVREADANTAQLDAQEVGFLRRASTAGSDVERSSVIQEYSKSITDAHTSGWISAQDVEKRTLRARAYLDNADLMGMIRTDPSKAATMLQDPKAFSSLDPVKREQYITAAVHGADEQAISTLQNKARFKPAIASMELGRVISPAHADAIFADGIIPQESGGRSDVVSTAGALGVSQVLPGTARDMATKLGLKDVAALDDATLKKRLLDDAPLNAKLGSTYFREMLTRYEGNIPLALAAYNAGPGNDSKPRADAWGMIAAEKFGPGFTAAQLASVIPISETKNYVMQIYGRMGANPNGAGVSAASIPRAATAIGGEIASQETQSKQVAHNLASTTRGADPITDLFTHGYQVDPARESAWRLTQEQSAAKGDAEAANSIRKLDEAKAMAPYVRAAYAMSPAALEAGVSQLEVDAAQNPNLSGEAYRRLTAFRAVRDEVKLKRDHDPIALAERGGLVRPVAVDPMAAPEDPNFRATMAERGRQADVTARFYLGKSEALKPEEAKAMKERFGNVGPDEQARLIQSFGATLTGKAYDDTLEQVTGKNSIANFAGRVARDRPALAREMLEGAALIASKDIPDRVKEMRPALAAKLGGQIYPSPQMQDDVVNAAMALYTARRGKSAALYDANDEGGLEKAIEDVTGPLVKRNGKRFPLPPTMGRPALDLIDGFNDADLAAQGGARDRNGKPMAAATIASYGQWTPLGVGSTRYVVDIAGKPVMNADGRSLVVDLASIAKTRPAPEQTPYQRGRSAFKGELFRDSETVRRQTEGDLP